jgi:hypothetical protein
MKRLGPDLKMPALKMSDLKMPPFLGDFLYDLRDRRLLAPIALVVVAIAAVPFLLASGSDLPAPTPPAGPATVPTGASTMTVVEAKPGLRDYHKRLARRQPTNPFKQLYTDTKAGSGAEPKSLSSTTGSSEGTTHGDEISSAGGSNTAPPSTSSPPSGPSGGGALKHHLTFYTWGINVWIHKVPKDPEADDEAITRPRVFAQTPLPGPSNSVVTFMGLSRQAAEKEKAARALFSVSDEVTRIVEGGKCLARGGDICELIEAEEGEAITFVYGPGETRYTIKVLKIELIVTGHS